MIVSLTPAELRIATWVGRQRFANAMANGRDPGSASHLRWPTPDNHIAGATAEWATAIALNLSWRPTIGQIDQPDVGGFVQVRSTSRRDGSLIIKPGEGGPFVLAIILNEAVVDVVGWFDAAEATRRYSLRRIPGCDDARYVPQSDLNPLMELSNVRAA